MKISKYLSVNSQILILITLIVIILVSFIVFLGLHKSILTEFIYVLVILAISLFLFLVIGLYKGIKILKNHPSELNKLDNVPFPTSYVSAIAKAYFLNDGIFLIIIPILIWLSVYFVLITVYSIAFLVIVFYWLFYWAYRVAFRHSKETKGNMAKSFLYSLAYTILYSGLFFVLIQVIKYFSHAG